MSFGVTTCVNQKNFFSYIYKDSTPNSRVYHFVQKEFVPVSKLPSFQRTMNAEKEGVCGLLRLKCADDAPTVER